MSKAETLRQSAAASNEARVAQLATGIDALKNARFQSVEELAAALEPIAQAMATLTDETRTTLLEIDRRTREQGDGFKTKLDTAAKTLEAAAAQAQTSADRMNEAGSRLEWSHYALAIGTAVTTAALVSAFWLLLAPPTVQNHLDAKAVAEQLKPAVIEALKPSKGR